MNLYYLCLVALQGVNLIELTVEEIDLVTDLKVQERVLFAKVDSSIRYHIKKTGVNVIKSTYIGFDTEYYNTSLKVNKMVSAQLAVGSKIQVKVPRTPSYRLSNLDVDRNKLVRECNNSDVFNYSKLESSVQWLIQQIKAIKIGKYEESMMILTESLKIIEGLTYHENDESTTFSFPRSPIQPYILLKGETSLVEITQIAHNLSKTHLDKQCADFESLFLDIFARKFSILEGKDKLLETIHTSFNTNHYYKDELLESDKILDYIVHTEDGEFAVVKNEKRLTRVFYDNVVNGSKVCINTSHNYYLTAHLTQADLCMLSDFEQIKEGLNIVNGSFVTLNKPLKIGDRVIHVRDTMLLAPVGSKKLEQIGNLYGDSYQKINISADDLFNMGEFLSRDRDKFIEYALRDALITLVHAY